MSPEEEKISLHRQIDFLESELSKVLELMPTPEELAYLRNSKLAQERSSWAWQQLRVYAPWVISIGGTIGSAVYWFVTHFSWRGNPP